MQSLRNSIYKKYMVSYTPSNMARSIRIRDGVGYHEARFSKGIDSNIMSPVYLTKRTLRETISEVRRLR